MLILNHSMSSACHLSFLTDTIGHVYDNSHCSVFSESTARKAMPICSNPFLLILDLQESERAHAKSFIEELVEATQSLISLFDCVMYASEIIPGSEL